MSGTILIVDDDPVQRRLLEAMARRFGYEPVVMDNGSDAVDLLTQPGRGGVDVLVLDLVMPDLDGFAVMERLRKANIDLPILVQTGNGSIDTVISAMRAGAADFMVKPVGPERFQVSIRNALKTDALASEVRRVHRRVAGTLSFEDMQSNSEAMKAALSLGRRASCVRHRGPARRRNRHRQGNLRPRHRGLERARRQAVRCRQLRGDPRKPRRERAVRP